MENPKEEALDMFVEFLQIIPDYVIPENKIASELAKQSAIISVNKILEAIPKTIAIDGYGPAQFKNPDIEFWTEVLIELEKL